MEKSDSLFTFVTETGKDIRIAIYELTDESEVKKDYMVNIGILSGDK